MKVRKVIDLRLGELESLVGDVAVFAVLPGRKDIRAGRGAGAV